MPHNALRSLLNRLRWDPRQAGTAAVLAIRERRDGTAGRAELALAEVAEVTAWGLVRRDRTFIPFHRVLEVRCGDAVLFPTKGEGRDAT